MILAPLSRISSTHQCPASLPLSSETPHRFVKWTGSNKWQLKKITGKKWCKESSNCTWCFMALLLSIQMIMTWILMVNTDVKTEVTLQWVRPCFFEMLCKYLPVTLPSSQQAMQSCCCFFRRQIDGGEIQEDLSVKLQSYSKDGQRESKPVLHNQPQINLWVCDQDD